MTDHDPRRDSPPACGGHRRNVYLRMTGLAEARALLSERFAAVLDAEEVPVAEAVGRVLAQAVHARVSAPSYHGAAMDGFAVLAEQTFGASEASPMDLALGLRAHPVNTGDVLPGGTDAVVMIEHVQVLDAAIRIEAPAFPWQHVRRVGEDIVATEMLFARHRRVRPTCVGALMAGGIFEVPVLRQPRVLIVPTGAEIVSADQVRVDALQPGTIIEFNGTMLGKLVEEAGGAYTLHPCIADDLDHICEVIVDAVRAYDLVLVIGGSSAGARDFTRAAAEAVGEVLVHGVTMMPGKPTVLADVEGKPVVGVPGYPVSAILCFEQLVAPLLARMQGVSPVRRPVVRAHPTRKIASRLGMDEFVRVRLGRVGERLVATPLPGGSATVTTFTRADGMLCIPTDLEGLHAHEPARVELLRPLHEIEQNVVAVGSHDLCLDLIADLLRARGVGVTLASSHVGSLGGLRALRKGACHMAGSHLLDPSEGSYNLSFVRRYLADVPVQLVHLVDREQGLAVPRGNPKGVRGPDDLVRQDLHFVNRQAGSGTRVLLDHLLAEASIEANRIQGYGTEEFTHMAVAVAVASGAADAGLCVRSAARALGLDFLPLATERYELVIPVEFLDHEGVQQVLEVIDSEEFRRGAVELGGYDVVRTGSVRTVD